MSQEEEFPTFPVVLVIDRSESMAPVMNDVTVGVNGLIERLAANADTRETVALGVIEFHEKATVRRPLRWLDQDDHPTRIVFEAKYRTNFERALGQASTMLTEALPKLSKRGWRPAVFFVSDGYPNEGDAWEGARARLLSPTNGPNLVTLGVGNQNAEVLSRLASSTKLHRQFDHDAGGIDELIKALLSTIVDYAGGGLRESSEGSLADEILRRDGGHGTPIKVLEF